jgi:hypothetical protein
MIMEPGRIPRWSRRMGGTESENRPVALGQPD